MGLFNVIKIANDYAKAKKYLETRKGDIENVKKFIENVKKYIEYLGGLKTELENIIATAKDVLTNLKKVVKGE